jgi:DNA polymerase III subunit beta
MKFNVEKNNFLYGLQMVQSTVSIHSPTPILFNVLIEAEKNKLNLTATDSYVTLKCSVEADITQKGITTIPARRLFNIIRALPDQSIECTVDDDNTMEIKCAASTYKVLGLAADDFPVMDINKKARSFSIDQNTLKQMLVNTAYASSEEDTRQILNGVLLQLKDQKLTIVATDGRRLALVEQEAELPEAEEEKLVIPVKTVNELIRVLEDKGKVIITIQKKLVSFEINHIKIISKLIEGNYPNFRQVIPSQYEERLTVDRESFLLALRRVSLVTNEKFPSAQVSFTKNLMKIYAITPEIGEAYETVPIKYSGKEITMAFNPLYIIEPLKNLLTDEIYLELTDDLSPAIIKTTVPFLYVLMPLRTNE